MSEPQDTTGGLSGERRAMTTTPLSPAELRELTFGEHKRTLAEVEAAWERAGVVPASVLVDMFAALRELLSAPEPGSVEEMLAKLQERLYYWNQPPRWANTCSENIRDELQLLLDAIPAKQPQDTTGGLSGAEEMRTGKFRKKPVVISAVRWFKNGDHPDDGDERFADGPYTGELYEGRVVRYYRTPAGNGQTPCKHCGAIMHLHGWIDTLEGGHIVCPGDWVITGVRGERYPCKPDIFAATYEPAIPLPAKQPQDDRGTEEVERLKAEVASLNADSLSFQQSIIAHRNWQAKAEDDRTPEETAETNVGRESLLSQTPSRRYAKHTIEEIEAFLRRRVSNSNGRRAKRYALAMLEHLYEMAAELSALRSDRAANKARIGEWFDIATAPKDGTMIWTLWDGFNHHEGQPARYYHAAYYDDGAESEDLAWRDCEGNHIDEPTHWRPLPDPPASLPAIKQESGNG